MPQLSIIAPIVLFLALLTQKVMPFNIYPVNDLESQSLPSIVALDNGHFGVFYTALNMSQNQIWYNIMDKNGNKFGDKILIETLSALGFPVKRPDGYIVFAYVVNDMSGNGDGYYTGIFGIKCTPSLDSCGSRVQVNTYATGY